MKKINWYAVRDANNALLDYSNSGEIYFLLTADEYERGCKNGRERRAEIEQLKSQVKGLERKIAELRGSPSLHQELTKLRGILTAIHDLTWKSVR